jgi:hypothetical protein
MYNVFLRPSKLKADIFLIRSPVKGFTLFCATSHKSKYNEEVGLGL